MTIIEPNKNNLFQGIFAYFTGALIFLVVLSIYFYNLNVNLKFSISAQEKSIQQLEAENADLRNEMYRILDVRNLTALIQKQNLVQDKNPDYLEHAVLASR